MNEIEMAIDAIGIALAQEPPAAIEQGYGFYLVIEDALATALTALREQAEREKPECWVKKETDGGMLAICPKCSYPISWWHKTPFCSHCGKRLEVEP